MPGPGDLHDLAEAILDAAVEALDTIPDFDPSLLGSPERAFVSPGLPVSDFVGADCCSQLAIWVTPTAEMDTFPGGNDVGKRSARYAWKNQVGFSLQVNRCIPTGTSSSVGVYSPPTPTQLTEAARQHDADHWALWNHMHNAVHAGRILDLCDNVTIQNIVAAVPSGGCAGWTMTLSASLDGYGELFGS